MSNDSPPGPHLAASSPEPWLKLRSSLGFAEWLDSVQCSLAFSGYQTGKVFFAGRNLDASLSLFERTFDRCMGLWASDDGRTLWLSSRFQLWRLERAPAEAVPSEGADGSPPGWTTRGFDAVYVPRVGYTTGDVDVHDIALDAQGRVVFACTLFSCLATLSERASFQPLWRPPFVSALSPDDRCHLNGLAMRDGRPAYVTVVAASDIPDGWRASRHDGGCVVDVSTGEVVAQGLSMPHAPRWHDGKLWLLNSGTGEFGFVNVSTGAFHPIAFVPGYLRGLSFIGDFAVVTTSMSRRETFQGLPLDEALAKRGAEPTCGVHVIDARTGVVAYSLRLESSVVTELYDVVLLRSVRQPMALGLKTTEIERMILVDEQGTL